MQLRSPSRQPSSTLSTMLTYAPEEVDTPSPARQRARGHRVGGKLTTAQGKCSAAQHGQRRRPCPAAPGWQRRCPLRPPSTPPTPAAPTDAVGKVLVGGADAGVQHVDVDPAAVQPRPGVVHPVQRQGQLVDAVQPAGGARGVGWLAGAVRAPLPQVCTTAQHTNHACLRARARGQSSPPGDADAVDARQAGAGELHRLDHVHSGHAVALKVGHRAAQGFAHGGQVVLRGAAVAAQLLCEGWLLSSWLKRASSSGRRRAANAHARAFASPTSESTVKEVKLQGTVAFSSTDWTPKSCDRGRAAQPRCLALQSHGCHSLLHHSRRHPSTTGRHSPPQTAPCRRPGSGRPPRRRRRPARCRWLPLLQQSRWAGSA